MALGGDAVMINVADLCKRTRAAYGDRKRIGVAYRGAETLFQALHGMMVSTSRAGVKTKPKMLRIEIPDSTTFGFGPIGSTFLVVTVSGREGGWCPDGGIHVDFYGEYQSTDQIVFPPGVVAYIQRHKRGYTKRDVITYGSPPPRLYTNARPISPSAP